MKDRNDKDKDAGLPGYPLYAPEDDIYNHGHKDPHIHPGEHNPVHPEPNGKNNEKDFDEDMTGEDLDIPGADLDDEMEEIGSEDEENNYYSLDDDGLEEESDQ